MPAKARAVGGCVWGGATTRDSMVVIAIGHNKQMSDLTANPAECKRRRRFGPIVRSFRPAYGGNRNHRLVRWFRRHPGTRRLFAILKPKVAVDTRLPKETRARSGRG